MKRILLLALLSFMALGIFAQDLDTTFQGGDTILPVEFLMFTAKVDEAAIQLEWATATETSNSHFSIEHSRDGQTYKEVDIMFGAGSTQEAQYYSYIHKHPFFGMNYYRLKQVDFDGDYEYSDIVVVMSREDRSGVKLSPVPTSNTLTVNTDSVWKSLEIVNNHGFILKSFELDTAHVLRDYEIDMSKFASGHYFILLTSKNGKRQLEKVVKTGN